MPSDTSQRRIVNASLLRVIVDQFVGRPTHPIGDIKQFEQLALGLIDLVDADEVAQAARPLCFHPETPPSIFARLFEKGGACAQLAFEYAQALPRSEMLVAAEHGDAALAAALARRRDLDRDAVAALASRGEREVLRGLAGNLAAHLDAASRRALTLAARDDLTLARMLLDRDDVEIDPEPLFLAATRLERMAIILDACRKALAGGYMETRRADPEFVERLESAARRKDRDAMAGLLAEAFDCRKDRARGLLSDAHGEALALALAALGVDAETATRIFLCAGASISHDVDRVRSLLALLRSTPQRAAAHIVAAVTGAQRPEKEPPRRSGWRDEAQAGQGWRRALPRQGGATAATPRKFDQSA